MKKPYLPLMMGDWRMLTSGLRADAKGVLIGLLIHQYHHGHLPADILDLALIEPEVGRVWVSISGLFQSSGPGQIQNPELEEVRAFWSKQAANGSKGGRKSKAKPDGNPELNPNNNPKHKPQYDLDLDPEVVKKTEESVRRKLAEGLDEITLDQLRVTFGSRVNFDQEVQDFKTKVLVAPSQYRSHEAAGFRLAFIHQLKNVKQQPNGKHNPALRTDRKQAHTDQLVRDYAAINSSDSPGGDGGTVQADGLRAAG